MKKLIAVILTLLLLLNMILPILAISPGGTEKSDGGIATQTKSKTISNIFSFDRTSNVGYSPSVTLTNTDKKEGNASFKMPGNSANGLSVWLTWSQLGDGLMNHLNLSSYNPSDLGIGLWIKTTDITKLSGFTVQIGSNGDFNNNYFLWYVQNSIVSENNTWTYVTLKFSDVINQLSSTSKVGILDIANINAFRLLFSGNTTGADFYFDGATILDLKSVSEWSFSDPYHTSQSFINLCEDSKNMQHWANGVLQPVTMSNHTTQGINSNQLNLLAGSNTIQITPSQMNEIDLKNTIYSYLVFDLYVSNVSDISMNNFIEQLCYSMNGSFNDTDNITWWNKQLNNGWNHFVLPFNSASQTSSKTYADIVKNGIGPNKNGKAAINFFRLYFNSNVDTIIYIDNITILKEEDGIGYASNYKIASSLLDFDRAENIGCMPSFALVNSDRKEGAASYKIPGTTANNLSIWATGSQLGDKTANHINLSSYSASDLGVGLWVKTTDFTKFSGLTVQITSNGNYENNYFMWYVSNSVVTANNTWTYVVLKFSDVINLAANTSKLGNFNIANINAFRMFFSGNTTGADFYFDGFGILDLKQVTQFDLPDPVHDAQFDINNCENTSNIDFWVNGVRGTKSLSTYKTQGSSAYQLNLASGANTIQVLPNSMSEIDLSGCNERYLTFDMYIPNVNAISLSNFKAQLCYSLNGTYNGTNDMTWLFKQIHSGWNHFILPFNTSSTTLSREYADIVKNGTGPTKNGVATVNYFRMSINSSALTNIYLDNIKILGVKTNTLIKTPSLTVRTTDLDEYKSVVTVCSTADFGAIGNDVIDDTTAFKKALDYTESLGGGTIWVPQGKYVISSELRISNNVYLLGQWTNPETNPTQIANGTVLQVHTGKNEIYGSPFISIGSSAGIIGLTIYYPDQTITNPAYFPTTVKANDCSGGTNGFSTIRYVTLVNPYTGISFGPDGNELGFVDHVYMSPLHKGIFVSLSTDIMRIQNIFISSSYYKLFDNTINQDTLKTTMKNQVIGIEIQRSDWQYIYNYTAKDIKTGLLYKKQENISGALVDSASSEIFNVTMSNVVTGIDFEYNKMPHQFTKLNISADTNAIKLQNNFSGSLVIDGGIFSTISGSNIVLNSGCTGVVSILDSTFSSWPAGNYGLYAQGGGVLVQSCVGSATGTTVNLAPGTAAGTFDYNQNVTIVKDSSVTNYASFTNTYNNKTYYNTVPDLGTCPSPTGSGFTSVISFGADKTGVIDSTSTFTNALNYVSGQGGGIVYVPAGKYLLSGTLSIPTGVELRGVSEAGHHTSSMGSVLLTTQGSGNANGTPFITLQTSSGVRGINVWYPNQTMLNPTVYPYTFKNNGQNIWIVNVNIGNGYKGVDFRTNSGGHYVQFLTGFNHMNDITVDDSTTKGRLINCHFNPTFLIRTDPNLLQNGGDINGVFLTEFLPQIDATKDGSVIFGRTTTEQVFAVFNYRAKVGMKLIAGTGGNFDGFMLATGMDGTVKAITISSTSSNYALFTNCVFATVPTQTNYIVQTGGLVRMANCAFGAFNFNPSDGIYISGGTLELRAATIDGSAANGGIKLNGSGASVLLDGSVFMHTGPSLGNVFLDQTDTQVIDIVQTSGALTMGCNIARKFWKYSPTSLAGTSRNVSLIITGTSPSGAETNNGGVSSNEFGNENEPVVSESILINDCENTSNIEFWDGSGAKPTVGISPFKTQGASSYVMPLKTGENIMAMHSGIITTPIDLTAYQKCYLVADVFITDITKINLSAGFKIGISNVESGGFNDDQNITWLLKKINNGWNHIVLPFISTTGTKDLGYADVTNFGGGPIDSSGNCNVNYIRFLINSTESININIDNIKFLGVYPPVNFDSFRVSKSNIITNIKNATTVASFKSMINPTTNVKVTFKAIDSEVPLDDNDFIGTGTTVNVEDSDGISTEYSIIRYGDVDGDGLINLDDLVIIRDCLLEVKQITGLLKTAGDLYGQNYITLNVMVGMMDSIAEKININQDRIIV